MKIVDPHIDLADLYVALGLNADNFTHDTPTNPVSLEKLKDNETDIVGLTLYVYQDAVKTTFYDAAKEYYDFYQEVFRKSGNLFYAITDRSSLVTKPSDTVGYFLTLEGLECFRTPDDFDEFYNLGVRMLDFAWSTDNDYARGRDTVNDTGLSAAGKAVVNKMNTTKIVADIAHMSHQSVKDLANSYSGIIVTTHGNVAAVHKTAHNLSDDEIQIIVASGGVVGLMPLKNSTGPNGTFDELFHHLSYIADKWGLEHIGFSSDIFPLPEYPFINGYTDVSVMKHLQTYLLTKLSPKEVEQVMYGNWLRVLRKSL